MTNRKNASTSMSPQYVVILVYNIIIRNLNILYFFDGRKTKLEQKSSILILIHSEIKISLTIQFYDYSVMNYYNYYNKTNT